MCNSGSDKNQLKNIFEESLKEISSEGTDEFRRSVTEVLERKPSGRKAKNPEQAKKDAASGGGLNTTKR